MHFPLSVSQLHFRGHKNEQLQPNAQESIRPGQASNQTIDFNECVVDVSTHLNTIFDAQQVLPMAAPTSHELFHHDALQNIMTHIANQADGLALTAQLKKVSHTFNKQAEHTLVSEKKLMRELVQQLNQDLSSLQNHINTHQMHPAAIDSYLNAEPSQYNILDTYGLIKNQPVKLVHLKDSPPITFEDMIIFRQKFTLGDLKDQQLLNQFRHFTKIHNNFDRSEINTLNRYSNLTQQFKNILKFSNCIGLLPSLSYALSKVFKSVDQLSFVPAIALIGSTYFASSYLMPKVCDLLSQLEINALNECRAARFREQVYTHSYSFDPTIDYEAITALVHQ